MKAFCWNGSMSSSEGCVRLVFGYPKNEAGLGQVAVLVKFCKGNEVFHVQKIGFHAILEVG